MSKKESEKYILTLSPEQAFIVERACEVYARLLIGQFNAISDELALRTKDFSDNRHMVNDLLNVAARLVFGENPPGRPDVKTTNEHHRAWSVYEVLRYARCWHEHPEGGWGVCFDTPMSMLMESLPTCEIKEEGVK